MSQWLAVGRTLVVYYLQAARTLCLVMVRSRAEAMAWVHTDLGAPRGSDDTARVWRELRQAAWSFWRSTRRHKESLPVPLPCAPALSWLRQRPPRAPHCTRGSQNPPPPPPSAYGQPMPLPGQIRHQYATHPKKMGEVRFFP
jgi:hypothetical protein